MNRICANLCCRNRIESSYIKWLVELIGPVILGSKPAEIISIPHNSCDFEERVRDVKNHFAKCSIVNAHFLKENERGVRVILYNPASMKKIFENRKIISFLRFIGYSDCKTYEDFLDELYYRLDNCDFPDEIGIFLGYPLKDVLGFMGYSKKPLTATKYWQIYGDMESSMKIYNSFLEHREEMRKMLETRDVSSILKTSA